jgi:hypothetical protein
LEECGPCPIFAGFTLAFDLQLKKKHRETSVRRLQYKSGTGNKENMPYAYDGEITLQCTMDGGDTNSKHLHESGVCETEVYSNVTNVELRAS